jgi:4-hydroxymandelate oxidase
MAVHGIAHPGGEVATARAAAVAGIPFTLSTMASRSIEEVATGAPDGTRWFQLYAQRDQGLSRSFVERASAAGYRAIVLTVDLPVLGYRERDLRSGFTLPPLGNFPVAPPTHQVTLRDRVDGAAGAPLAKALSWDDLESIRSWSSLPLVIKGILTAEDARLAAEHGVAGIVVSNHGARQLDRAPAPIDVLAEVVAAVDGRAEVLVDGGVRRGLDIAIALALGARGVLLGRPILWALAAGGQAGVERALAILREEFELTLALLGAPTPADIRREHLVGAGAVP